MQGAKACPRIGGVCTLRYSTRNLNMYLETDLHYPQDRELWAHMNILQHFQNHYSKLWDKLETNDNKFWFIFLDNYRISGSRREIPANVTFACAFGSSSILELASWMWCIRWSHD